MESTSIFLLFVVRLIVLKPGLTGKLYSVTETEKRAHLRYKSTGLNADYQTFSKFRKDVKVAVTKACKYCWPKSGNQTYAINQKTF